MVVKNESTWHIITNRPPWRTIAIGFLPFAVHNLTRITIKNVMAEIVFYASGGQEVSPNYRENILTIMLYFEDY